MPGPFFYSRAGLNSPEHQTTAGSRSKPTHSTFARQQLAPPPVSGPLPAEEPSPSAHPQQRALFVSPQRDIGARLAPRQGRRRPLVVGPDGSPRSPPPNRCLHNNGHQRGPVVPAHAAGFLIGVFVHVRARDWCFPAQQARHPRPFTEAPPHVPFQPRPARFPLRSRRRQRWGGGGGSGFFLIKDSAARDHPHEPARGPNFRAYPSPP